MNPQVTVVDYGMGNLRSVSKALESVGADVNVTADLSKVRDADRLVLPGVGAFGKAMRNLEEAGLREAILEFLRTERPFLGICLGLQLLFESSEEEKNCAGLGIFRGTVKRFVVDLKVPHVGWNTAKQTRCSAVFRDVPDDSYMYFVHSYYVDPEDKDTVVSRTEYGVTFTSAVQKENVVGVQFHPEKSQDTGLAVLANFVRLL